MTVEQELAAAIRGLLTDYRTEGCPDKTCGICRRSNAAVRATEEALKKVKS